MIARLRYLALRLVRRRRLAEDVDAELRDHIEREIADRIRAGEEPAEARRAALAAFGGLTRYAEETRGVHALPVLDAFGADLRHAARSIRRNPGYAAAIMGITAVGIGATCIVFSAVSGVLLHPLPFPDADRIAELRQFSPEGRWVGDGLDAWDALRAPNPVIDAAGAYGLRGTSTLLGGAEPVRARARFASPELLRLLGVPAHLGRTFVPDDVDAGTPVALISHALWRDMFAGDSGVVGRAINLDGTAHTVIGVMPAAFTSPSFAPTDIWLPMRMTADGGQAPGGVRRPSIVVRLRPGVTRAAAEAWLNTVARRRVVSPLTGDSVNAVAHLTGLREFAEREARQPLLMLMGAVGFVLLLVAATVATLTLSRAAARLPEMAVRRALGASRLQQARLLLTETALLTGLGGLAGLLIAWFGVTLLVRHAEDILPRLDEIHLDWRVTGFGIAMTVLVALLAGFAPAFKPGPDRDHHATLRTSSASATPPAHVGRARSLLVGVEVAAAAVLLVGTGLLLKGFLTVFPRDPGYAVAQRVSLSLSLPDSGAGPAETSARRLAFTERLGERVAALHGVSAVAWTTYLPLVRTTALYRTVPEGHEAQEVRLSHQRAVSANYFDVMRIPLIAGRAFTRADAHGTQPVAIINETAASQWWPAASPVGRHFSYGLPGGEPVTVEVVGVVRDVRFEATETRRVREFYLPFAQAPARPLNLVMVSNQAADALRPALKREVHALDPNLPINEVQSLGDIVSHAMQDARFYAVALGSFAIVAALLAAAGIFSLLAYDVAQRSREIGIRRALGAPHRHVAMLVTIRGAVAAGIGLAVGLAVARAVTRVLSGLLLEVEPTDPTAFVSAAAVLVLVGLAVWSIPLRRALRIDPLRCLRSE